MVDKNKEQLDRIEKKIDALEKKLDEHIKEIWTVYVPIKRLLEKLDKFRLWWYYEFWIFLLYLYSNAYFVSGDLS